MNRDRFGELVNEDQAEAADVVQLPHQCDGGWLDRDADQPRPCPHCKPHLARTRPPLPQPDPAQISAGVQLIRETLRTGHTPETLGVSRESTSDGPP